MRVQFGSPGNVLPYFGRLNRDDTGWQKMFSTDDEQKAVMILQAVVKDYQCVQNNPSNRRFSLQRPKDNEVIFDDFLNQLRLCIDLNIYASGDDYDEPVLHLIDMTTKQSITVPISEPGCGTVINVLMPDAVY